MEEVMSHSQLSDLFFRHEADLFRFLVRRIRCVSTARDLVRIEHNRAEILAEAHDLMSTAMASCSRTVVVRYTDRN